jgi:hypothetical protein
VPDQYASLAKALKAAKPGETVIVNGGTWKNVKVKKAGVRVIGNAAKLVGSTLVSGRGATLTGFTVQGTVVVKGDDAVVENCTIDAGDDGALGLRVIGASGVRIEGNTAALGRFVAERTEDVTFRDNVFTGGTKSKLLVAGDGAIVEGNVLRQTDLSIYGAGAQVSGNEAKMIYGEGADGLVLDGNTLGLGGIAVEGEGIVVQSNTVADGFVHVYGSDATIRENLAQGIQTGLGDGALVQDNVVGSGAIRIEDDLALVVGNTVGSDARGFPGAGITAIGDGVVIRDNTVETVGIGIFVPGDSAEILDNDLTVTDPRQDARLPAIQADGDEILVDNNQITHIEGFGITVRGDSAVVSDNDIHGISSSDAIHVEADLALITGNTMSQDTDSTTRANGVVLIGNGNLVTENVATDIHFDSYQVWAGSDNVLVENVSVDSARCGVRVNDAATGTKVSDCTVTNACVGLLNAGFDSCVESSSFTGSDNVDVFVGRVCHLFQSNSFDTYLEDLVQQVPPIGFD